MRAKKAERIAEAWRKELVATHGEFRARPYECTRKTERCKADEEDYIDNKFCRDHKLLLVKRTMKDTHRFAVHVNPSGLMTPCLVKELAEKEDALMVRLQIAPGS